MSRFTTRQVTGRQTTAKDRHEGRAQLKDGERNTERKDQT